MHACKPAHRFFLCLGLLFFAASTVASEPEASPVQQIIVKFADTSRNAVSTSEHAIDAMTDTGERLSIPLAHVRRLGTGADLFRLSTPVPENRSEELVTELRKRPDVIYAEVARPMRVSFLPEDAVPRQPSIDPVEIAQAPAVSQITEPVHGGFTPNDSRYNEQWHYYESTGGIRMPSAWSIASGAGVRVAVLDTGYRPHADLAANIVGGYDFISDPFNANDGNGRDADARDPGDWVNAGDCGPGTPHRNSRWHGTHVAGIVAAVTNNAVGVAGSAYGADIVPVRVVGRCEIDPEDLIDAITWASGGAVAGVPTNLHPARVLNMSFGTHDETGNAGCASSVQDAIDQARARGSVLIAAIGNSSVSGIETEGLMPANCDDVVVVAATDRPGNRAWYSHYGTTVDIAAPGGDMSTGTQNGILSTFNSGNTTPGSDSYAFLQGTSQAAPLVAGVAALMLSANSALTPDEVEIILKSTARPFPSSCTGCGAGIVNATAALNAALADSVPYGVSISAQFFGCLPDESIYRLTWSGHSGTTILQWKIDWQPSGASTWTTVYDGVGGVTIASVSTMGRFRARARNAYGWSGYAYTPYLNNTCGSGY